MDQANTAQIPLIVGAYAAMPSDLKAQEEFYNALSETGFVTGIEIPVRMGSLDLESPQWLARVLAGRFNNSVITAIPDTMRQLGVDPNFGIASPDVEGRNEGIKFIQNVLHQGNDFNEDAGEQIINRLELHSAPKKYAEAEYFAQSLEVLKEDAKLAGIQLVVEHCDARVGDGLGCGVGPGEKEFLPFSLELMACEQVGVPITINWGRSVLESHQLDTPVLQVETLVAAGLLGGIMCSGIASEDTQYGAAWADGHLPLNIDEEVSLLTADHVAKFVAAGKGTELYRGIKIQTPRNADISTRIAMIDHVYQAM